MAWLASSLITTAAGGDYFLVAETMDAGGRAAGSAAYELTSGIGEWAAEGGRSPYWLAAGFVAQISNPAGVSPTVISLTDGQTARLWVEGDSPVVTLDPTSAAGGTLGFEEGWIYYVAPGGYNGEDSFTYTVTDLWSQSVAGTVRVRVGVAVPPAQGTVPQNLLAISVLPNGRVLLQFIGIAGRTYTLEWTADLADPDWQTLAELVADRRGVIEYEDEGVTGTRFYRAVTY